jgi:hypothetical protein
MGVGRFLSDLLNAGMHVAARTSAAETDFSETEDRVEEALSESGEWDAESVARVLVSADPVTILGHERAAELYAGIAAAIVEETQAAGDRSARTIRKGLKAGIDALPRDLSIFIKRRSLKELPRRLAEMGAR